MSMRDSINQNSVIVTIVTILVLVGCATFIFRGFWNERPAKVGDVYYYDLNTQKVFMGAASMEQSVDAPSGPNSKGEPAGVRAYILSCEECANYTGMTTNQVEEAGGYIAYLYYTPKTQKSSEIPHGMGPSMGGIPDPFLRAASGGPWMLSTSPEGLRLIAASQEYCGSHELSRCSP